MRLDKNTGKHSFARLLQAGFLVAALGVVQTVFAQTTFAQTTFAQTAFDCRGLETHAALPAIEGAAGMFFAIKPELQSHHGLGDGTIAMLGDLSTALAARGTTLVLLPVPTRAQVLAHHLPPMAAHLGYDGANATAVHIDMVARLNRAGVTVADPLDDLRAAALNGERPFFETDPRPTTVGTQVLAKTVGAVLAQHPDFADVKRGIFKSTAGADVTLTSSMRVQLQTACQAELPAVTTKGFSTLKTAGSGAAGNRLVVLGTDITATAALNLPGFLSEATGLDTLGYGVAKGGAFGAMSSYLTSADFQVAPPKVLVWEWPVTASLANHGDQPLRELGVAAGNMCQQAIAVTRTSDGARVRADLSQISFGPDATILLDSGGIGLPFVRFHFIGADGLIRTRSIYRHKDQLLTGRFYLPLSGLDTAALRGVEIEGPAAFGLQTRLMSCS